VPTATDSLAESDETVRANIKSGTNASLSVFSATGTIHDAAGPVELLSGKILGGKLLVGKVVVRPPRSNTFIDLGAAAGLPVGTEIDVRNGVIELTSALGLGPIPFAARARTQRMRLSQGVFTIRQARRSAPITLVLSGPELARCRGRAGKGVRRLRAEGGGRFVVKGRYAESSSRSGRWLTEDRCGFTRVRVTRGPALVTDTVRRKTRLVGTGRAHTVRARP
jgi:hypothetical protein